MLVGERPDVTEAGLVDEGRADWRGVGDLPVLGLLDEEHIAEIGRVTERDGRVVRGGVAAEEITPFAQILIHADRVLIHIRRERALPEIVATVGTGVGGRDELGDR